MLFPECVIQIFAKAPIPGQVKTRLIPAVGETGAAQVYRVLLFRLAYKLAGDKLADTEIWCAPSTLHADFLHMQSLLDCSLFNQVGEDLGQRMSYAVNTALNEYQYVILIGADCPEMSTYYLKQAVVALSDGNDAVLGPAEDGGYVLIGLRRTIPCLFDGLPWGTDKVLEMTRDCLQRMGWVWKELPVLWDLDRPEDLSRFEDG